MSYENNANAQRAKDLLRHYLRIALPKFDSDTGAELDAIVDNIIIAATDEAADARRSALGA